MSGCLFYVTVPSHAPLIILFLCMNTWACNAKVHPNYADAFGLLGCNIYQVRFSFWAFLASESHTCPNAYGSI